MLDKANCLPSTYVVGVGRGKKAKVDIKWTNR
jgi:hypothetical protein